MSYADIDNLGTLITSLSEDASVDRITLAVAASDAWVNSKLPAPLTGTIPNLVEMAATYYAYVFILKNLYDTNGEESPMMDWYEKQANDLLSAYVEQNATEESTMHPYSGHLTPTNVFMGRNKRATRDYTDYNDVNEVDWEAEG